MSSAATLSFDEGEEIELEAWTAFAAKHELTYDPHVVGQETYKHARLPIQVYFGQAGYQPKPDPNGRIDWSACRPPEKARRIVFSTFWMDAALKDVAEMAIAAWRELGGTLDADPEIRLLIRVWPS
jgi:hypothetical protein